MNKYINLVGGNDDIIPKGGFPPLYECKKIDNIMDKKSDRKREYSNNDIISVKNILDTRRKEPFITLPDIKY